MFRRKFSLWVVLLFLVSGLKSQDIHFSHLHTSPLALNPAMTGVFEGNVRLIANYRNQWKSTTADYKTFMASADANLIGVTSSSVIGIGAQFYSDIAGDLNFRTNSNSLSVSIMQAFNEDKSHIVSAGIQIGQITQRFDPTKIVAYEDEPLLLTDGYNKISYMDISAGMLWYMRFRNSQFAYVGGSMLHINNPYVSFLGSTTTPENVGNLDDRQTAYRRIVIHGGANLKFNDLYTLIPNFIFMDQGPHQEFTFGTFIRYQNPIKKLKNAASFALGGWIRSHNANNSVRADAVVAAIRADFQQLTMTFSYDINVSTLAKVSDGRGGPEFSFMYTFGTQTMDKGNGQGQTAKPQKGKIKCPFF